MGWGGMGRDSLNASPRGNASPSAGTRWDIPWGKDGVWGHPAAPRDAGTLLPQGHPHPPASLPASPLEGLQGLSYAQTHPDHP